MCDGVVVIESGRVRASGSVAAIARALSPHLQVFVRALDPPESLERTLLEQPGVTDVRASRGGFLLALADEAAAARLLAALVGAGVRVVQFAPESANLEDAFLKLTEGKVQ
jgi:ABC-2 type transport system ATP-binding protein